MQEPMLTVIVGMANTAYRNGTEKLATLDRTPSVAAPQPTSVIGPRKRPRPARTANTMQTTSSVFGMMGPRTALKYGDAYDATLLNIGSVSRKPISGAVSTTPS